MASICLGKSSQGRKGSEVVHERLENNMCLICACLMTHHVLQRDSELHHDMIHLSIAFNSVLNHQNKGNYPIGLMFANGLT